MLISKYCKRWRSMGTITDTGGIWSLSRSWWGLHECVPLVKHMGWTLGTQHFSTSMWHFHKFTRLACCSPWGRKELDMTEQLNWLTDSESTHQTMPCLVFGHEYVVKRMKPRGNWGLGWSHLRLKSVRSGSSGDKPMILVWSNSSLVLVLRRLT